MGFDMRVAICYVTVMALDRSHSEIVRAACGTGTKTDLAHKIGPDVTRQNIVDWERRDLIPADRWMRFVDMGFTTYQELAAHVAAPAAGRAA